MAKETAFHRMAADFNNNIQNVVSEIKQNISVDVDTRQLDVALDSINRKFNDISSAGPENFQRAIQEASDELDQMLKALQGVGNSSGLDGVTRIVDDIRRGFNELLGNSVAVKDTFDKMNESILPVVQSSKDLSTVLEDINKQAAEGGKFFDQWTATARLLKDDMGGVGTILERLKQNAEDASKALVNIDASQLSTNLASSISSATEQLNRSLEETHQKINNLFKSDGKPEDLGNDIEDLNKKMKEIQNTIGTLKADVGSAGLGEEFGKIFSAIDDNALSLFNKFSRSLEDVPVEKLRNISKEVLEMAETFGQLSRATQDSDDIVGFLHNVLNGSNFSQDGGSAYYVNMLSDSIQGLNKVADDDSILRMMRQLNAMGGESSGIAEMQQALGGMKSQFKELQDLKAQAQSILGDPDSEGSETTAVVRNIIKAESEILAENKRALEALLDGMGGGGSNDLQSVQLMASLRDQADKLKISMMDLSGQLEKVGKDSGLEVLAKQMREIAEASDEAFNKMQAASARKFNEFAGQGVAMDDPFRENVQSHAAAHAYSDSAHHNRRVLRGSRDIENMAHQISSNEKSGVYKTKGFNADDVASKARELQVIMEKIDSQKGLFDSAMQSGDQDKIKELMGGLTGQQLLANDAAVNLGSSIGMSKKDLDNAPEEVKDMVRKIQQAVRDVKDSNGNLISIGKIFDDREIDEATAALDRYNKEFDETQRSFNAMGGASFGNVLTGMGKKAFNGVTNAATNGLGIMGLSALPVTAAGIKQYAAGTFESYKNQGSIEAEMALANLARGGSYDGEFNAEMQKGIDLHTATNGLIQNDQLARNYSSISRNVIGQTGGSSLTSGDKSSLSEMSTLIQGAGLANQGTIESAMNTYYKELGLNVKETEYQFSKMLQTSQMLNIPFEKQLTQVAELSKQFKAMGLETDAATNAYVNLTAGGMHEDLAQGYSSSLARGITGMDYGSLAYGGVMSGAFSDPLTAAGQKYNLWDTNGNAKEGEFDKMAQSFESMMDLYGSVGGGHEGVTRMALGDYLSGMGLSQQQAGMGVERYLQGDDLSDIFKDAALLAEGVGENSTDKVMEGVKDAIVGASDNLSGIEKTLSALANSQAQIALSNEESFDKLTDYSDVVEKVAGTLNDGIVGLMNSIDGLDAGMNSIIGALALAGLAGPLLSGGAALLKGGSALAKGAKNSSAQRRAARRNGTNTGRSNTSADDDNDNDDDDNNTRQTRTSRNASRPKFKLGKKGIIGGLATLAGIGIGASSADASGFDTSDITGGVSDIFGNTTESIGGFLRGEGGGGSLEGDSAVSILKQILDVITSGGVAISGGTSGGTSASTSSAKVPTQASAANSEEMALEAMEHLASNSYNDTTAQDLAIASGYTGVGLLQASSKVAQKYNVGGRSGRGSRPDPLDMEDAIRNNALRNSRRQDRIGSSAIVKNLGKAAKYVPLLGAGVAALDIGTTMKGTYDVNKLAGLEGYGKDYADDAVEGAASAGVFTGGATLGAGIGSLFGGVGAIPGALIGGTVASVADWGMRATNSYDGISGWFGLGDEDLKKDKMAKSDIYKEGMHFKDRYEKTINSEIDEGFAVAAGQGLTKYGTGLNLSTKDKDNWAATYAMNLGEGKTEEQAKKAADKLFQLSIGQEEAKELNKQQLMKMIEQYGILESQGTDINSLLKDYLPADSSERNKILKNTEEATGLSKDILNNISKDLGLTLDQLLAMITQNGGNNGVFIDKDSDNDLRKKLKAQGVTGTDAEGIISAYLGNTATMSSSNMTEQEKIKWATAFSGASGVDGLDAKTYADDYVKGYRRDNNVVTSIKGDSAYKTFAKTEKASDYLEGTSADKVIRDWANQSGMSSFNMNQSLKENGMNQNTFAAYLQANRGSGGKWNSDVVADVTNGKLIDYSKETLYTLEQSKKNQDAYNHEKTLQDIKFEDYDKLTQDHNKKSEEQTSFGHKILEEIKGSIVALPTLIGSSISTGLSGGTGYTSDGVDNNSYGGGSASGFLGKNLKNKTNLSAEQINDWIDSKTKDKPDSVLRGQGAAFVKAAEASGLDPLYLVAHAAHETGWGTSNIAKQKGNMFGIGAFDSSPMASAFKYGGTESGIVEGAKWIAKNYTNKGQDTLSSMRHNGGKHEYATDPLWDEKIAAIMSSGPTGSSSGGGGGGSTLSNLAKSALSASPAGKFMSMFAGGDVGGELAAEYDLSLMSSGQAQDTAKWYQDNFNVTSKFNNSESFRGGKTHGGTDYDQVMGHELRAVLGGEVIAAVRGTTGLGNYVKIKNSDGTTSTYAHMKDINVRVGDKIGAGTKIGTVGNSGSVYSTSGGDGSHLHLEVADANGTKMDPEKWMNNIAGGGYTGSSSSSGSGSSAGGSSSSLNEEEMASYTMPIDVNIGKYDPFSGIGDVNANRKNNHKSIYGEASSIAVGRNGINYQQFAAQSAANFQSRENSMSVNVSIDAHESLSTASKEFLEELQLGVQKAVKETAQKYAAKAANDMGSSLVNKLRKDD